MLRCFTELEDLLKRATYFVAKNWRQMWDVGCGMAIATDEAGEQMM